jgi:tripartite-type tricarboxylate transporter receptor subunit TctC
MEYKTFSLAAGALAFAVAAGGFVPGASAPAAQASDFPNGTVSVIIPFPPGGSDTLGRRIVDTVVQMTGAEMVVLNVPGASTQIASRQVTEAEPDGYTIYISSPPELVAGVVFNPDQPFDPLTDFTLISFTAEAPFLLLIDPRLGVTDYAGFEAFLRENPDDVRFGSYGAVSQSQVIASRYRAATGVDFDIIPYSGGTPAFNAMLAGEIQALFATTIPTRGFITERQMLAMAATTGERTPLYPDLPTLSELGFDIVDSVSFGLVGPAGLPDDIVAFWENAWRDAMNEPETRGFIEAMGVSVVGSTPDEFRDWLTESIALWSTFPEVLGLEN